jgi:hypothetical protein
MTPLLPQPTPWPIGEALAWARARRWDSLPAIGSVALQPVPHRVDEETLPPGLERWLPREGIADLVVRSQGSGLKPSWHPANGLYGFVGLPPGPHTFTVEDPRGRFLPARLAVTVPDRADVAKRLRRLERPPGGDDWRPLVRRLSLRPAAGAPPRSGATLIWGEVRDSADQPVSHALVQLETRFRGVPATATTWSDAGGGYALDLDGERPDPLLTPPDGVEREGRLCLPLPPLPGGDPRPWIERMPELHLALLQALAANGAPMGYRPPRLSTAAGGPASPAFRFRFRDGPGAPLQEAPRLRLKIGRPQRCDLLLI